MSWKLIDDIYLVYNLGDDLEHYMNFFDNFFKPYV